MVQEATAGNPASPGVWPSLALETWPDTRATLHLWTQIIGKIRMARSPMVNHWWQVPLYVTCRGLTTSPIPEGTRLFQIDFDFLDHRLLVQTSDGANRSVPLQAHSVAGFYQKVMEALQSMGIAVQIATMPAEGAGTVPFEKDRDHAAYDPEAARRFWQVLIQAHRLLSRFRARFVGKVSPVHLFWGALDIAVTRFSGRPAPPHASTPGLPDRVTRTAYSHEVSSAGFWPGGNGAPAFFYSYAYPEPPGFREYSGLPREASYDKGFGEFVLPYEAVRTAPDPDCLLAAFLQSTYEAAADLGRWDRKALEDETALEWSPGQ